MTTTLPIQLQATWASNVLADHGAGVAAGDPELFHRDCLPAHNVHWATSPRASRRKGKYSSHGVAIKSVANPFLPTVPRAPFVIFGCPSRFADEHSKQYSAGITLISSRAGWPGFKPTDKSRHCEILGRYRIIALVKSKPGDFDSLPQARQDEIITRTHMALRACGGEGNVKGVAKDEGAKGWGFRAISPAGSVKRRRAPRQEDVDRMEADRIRTKEDYESFSHGDMLWEVWALDESKAGQEEMEAQLREARANQDTRPPEGYSKDKTESWEAMKARSEVIRRRQRPAFEVADVL